MKEVENGRELVTRMWEMHYRPKIQEFLDTNRSDTVPVSNSEYQNTIHDVSREVEIIADDGRPDVRGVHQVYSQWTLFPL